MSKKAISKALGIEETTELVPIEPKQEIMPVQLQTDQEEDYKLSRKTFKDLINKGSVALDYMTELAKESESPRAYEVLATLMKTVSDTTKDLYDLQKKTKDLKPDTKAPSGEGTINVEKAVFVGSTAELLDRVKNTKNES